MHLAYRVGKVGEKLREASPNKHLFKSRLTLFWDGSVKLMIEPLQAVAATFPSLFESSMLSGDVVRMDPFSSSHCLVLMISLLMYRYLNRTQCGAMLCRSLSCFISFAAGENLASVSKSFVLCIQQAVSDRKYLLLDAYSWQSYTLIFICCHFIDPEPPSTKSGALQHNGSIPSSRTCLRKANY